MILETDILILGAGLSGLAAASALGRSAVVLERNRRPGGLVRSECYGGYWFDHVLHLLYFPDQETEKRVLSLDADLTPCMPRAWVETAAGTARFPIQMHLNGLEPAMVVRCLKDLAELTFRPPAGTPSNFEQMLLATFGQGLCDLFMFPYNRKVWKRPLSELAPSGFTWNITRPNLEKVLRGAIETRSDFQAYNANGWYPRPPAGANARGMEVLTHALAGHAADLRLEHTIQSIDLETRTVQAEHQGKPRTWRFGQACISTLPLPEVLRICRQTPADLLHELRRLPRNRVWTAMFSIRGPRPQGCGHWRYYADESLIFTRLVFMHEFDPLTAPPEGWGLMAELIEPAENPPEDPQRLLDRTLADVQRAGVLPPGSEVIDRHLLLVDPAYVVFTVKNQCIIDEAQRFLQRHDVLPLGRYGRWEYSSMAQVMRDGYTLATELSARPPLPITPQVIGSYTRSRS